MVVCMQDANAALSADCEQKVAEAARLQAVNTRLQADNDKIMGEVSSPHHGSVNSIAGACLTPLCLAHRMYHEHSQQQCADV